MAFQPKLKTETLSGKFYYTRLNEPLTELKTKDGIKQIKPQRKLTLGLSPAGVKKAKELNLFIREPNANIPEPHVEMSRLVKDLNDPNKSRPKVLDENGDQWDFDNLIGNGSTGSVDFTVWGGELPGKFANAAIMTVRIIQYVPYENKTNNSFVSGFANKQPPSPPVQAQVVNEVPPATKRTPVSYTPKKQEQEIDDTIPF